jgi:hypothetical protein
MPGLARDLDVGADGSVWVIGWGATATTDTTIYKWNGTAWIAVDGAAIKIAVAPDGTPWALNSTGAIFHRINNVWTQMPGLARDLDANTEKGPSFIMSVNLPGIGNGPASDGLNNNPKHPERKIVARLTSQSNTSIDLNGTLRYNSAASQYKGLIPLPAGFVPGTYRVKIKLNNTLWKNLGSYPVAENSEISEDGVVLGDVDQDNVISLPDYNEFLTCKKVLDTITRVEGEWPNECVRKEAYDFNDDGIIDEIDLNTIFRGFSNRQGD